MTPNARMLAILAATVLGCGMPARPAGVHIFPQPGTHRGRDIVTGLELRTVRGVSTLEVIQRLRPEFFLGSARSPLDGDLQVYLDGVYQGGVWALRTIPVSMIVEVRYLTASAASDRFGPYRQRASAIAVKTRE